MRRARWKRKSVCSKLAHRCKFGGNGFCENCCAGEELRTKSRAGCRACPALYAVLIVASNLRVQRGHPLPPFPLPLPLSLEGFPKGRNRSFAPLSRFKGVRGEIEIPPRFSLGGPGGTFSFQKRISPLASRPGNRGRPLRQRPLPLAPTWECPLAGAENYAKAHGDAVRFLFSRNHDGCPSKFQALRKGK